MKYVDEFRDRTLAETLAAAIRAEVKPDRTYRFMEFCGGHTHAIFRYGVQDLMPDNVEYIHGPGCPVCILPVRRLDDAIELAALPDVILCSYGDMLRVPGTGRKSLMSAKAAGADIRMVYSTIDALTIARKNPDKQVIFLGIGFETTTPPTAIAIQQAADEGIGNFSVFCNHVLTPAALSVILDAPVTDPGQAVQLDGIIGPSHVSSVIGSAPYEFHAERYGKPVVIAGFEPLDVMQATLMLIRQANEGRCTVENQYVRAVTRRGNETAQDLVARIFERRPAFEWRGLGSLPDSALAIRDEYAAFDAEKRFAISDKASRETKSCECPSILRGIKKPKDCKLFGKACTPETPMGACMVSSEGSCAAYWTYRRAETLAEMAAEAAAALEPAE